MSNALSGDCFVMMRLRHSQLQSAVVLQLPCKHTKPLHCPIALTGQPAHEVRWGFNAMANIWQLMTMLWELNS
jgi:hypothetical protein